MAFENKIIRNYFILINLFLQSNTSCQGQVVDDSILILLIDCLSRVSILTFLLKLFLLLGMFKNSFAITASFSFNIILY